MVVDKDHPEAGFVELEPLAVGVVDLVFVIIAIAGLIVVCAGWVIGWLMQEALGGISIFGFHPFGFVGSLIKDATANIAGLLIKRVTAFGEMIWSIARTVWSFCYVVLAMFQWVVSYISGSHQQLQQGLAVQAAKEQNDINTLDTIIAAESDNLQNQITGIDIQVPISISQAEAASNTLAQTLYQQSIAFTQQGVHNAEVYTDTQVGNLNANVGNQINATQQLAQGLFNRAESDLANTTNVLEQQITNGVATAENFATGLLGGLGIGSVAQTLTALQGQVSKIATETTECLDPLCDTVTPNAKQLGDLGSLLKALEALFGAAALTGLLVAAVEDPKRAADDVVNVAGWMGDAGLGLVNVIGDAAGVKL